MLYEVITDLSMGENINELRRGILARCPIPLGTVPVYQTVADLVERQKKDIGEVSVDQLLKTIEQQAQDGVDFMTIHCVV